MARTNSQLRRALLERLKITPQGLHERAKKKMKLLPMGPDEATYLIAHEEGLRLDKFLDRDTVAHIRQLHSQVQGSRAQPIPNRPAKLAGAMREIRFPGDFSTSDPVLPDRTLNEAVAMAKVYPVLYVLENSVREVIKRVMAHHHGESWWDTELTSAKLKQVANTVDSRMKKESQQKWHQRRGAHPIDYADIDDLERIIAARPSLFVPGVISDLEWFRGFMKELYPSRNVVCHMNPLAADNTQHVKLKLKQWQRMLRENSANIPPSIG